MFILPPQILIREHFHLSTMRKFVIMAGGLVGYFDREQVAGVG